MEHAPTSATVGSRLRSARRDASIGRTRAAAQIGVADDTLGRYEAGDTDISYRQAVELARLYDVPVDSFMQTADGVAV